MAKKVKKATTAKEVQTSSKDALATAKKNLTTFLKKNGLARDEDHSGSKKYGKEFKELTLAVDKASDSMDEGNTKVKAAKATKTKADKAEGKTPGRATQYEYPEGLTSAEKKEFRVKARRDAKALAKGDSPKAEKAAKAPKAEKASGGKKEVAAEETKKVKEKGDKKKKKKSSKND